MSSDIESLIVRETQMRPSCGPVEIAPRPSSLSPTRSRAMTSGAPGFDSAQLMQARCRFEARNSVANRIHGKPVLSSY